MTVSATARREQPVVAQIEWRFHFRRSGYFQMALLPNLGNNAVYFQEYNKGFEITSTKKNRRAKSTGGSSGLSDWSV